MPTRKRDKKSNESSFNTKKSKKSESNKSEFQTYLDDDAAKSGYIDLTSTQNCVKSENTAIAINNVAEFLKTQNKLFFITFSGRSLEISQNADALIQLIQQKLRRIKSLDIVRTNITSVNMQRIFNHFHVSECLTHLYLSDNRKAFSKSTTLNGLINFLCSNKSLEELYITDNSLDETFENELLQILPQTKLKYIVLYDEEQKQKDFAEKVRSIVGKRDFVEIPQIMNQQTSANQIISNECSSNEEIFDDLADNVLFQYFDFGSTPTSHLQKYSFNGLFSDFDHEFDFNQIENNHRSK